MFTLSLLPMLTLPWGLSASSVISFTFLIFTCCLLAVGRYYTTHLNRKELPVRCSALSWKFGPQHSYGWCNCAVCNQVYLSRLFSRLDRELPKSATPCTVWSPVFAACFCTAYRTSNDQYFSMIVITFEWNDHRQRASLYFTAIGENCSVYVNYRNHCWIYLCYKSLNIVCGGI